MLAATQEAAAASKQKLYNRACVCVNVHTAHLYVNCMFNSQNRGSLLSSFFPIPFCLNSLTSLAERALRADNLITNPLFSFCPRTTNKACEPNHVWGCIK